MIWASRKTPCMNACNSQLGKQSQEEILCFGKNMNKSEVVRNCMDAETSSTKCEAGRVCHGGTSKSHSRSWDRTWRAMERAFLSMLGSTAGIHFSSVSDKTVPQKSQLIQEAQCERQESSLTFEVNPQINLTIGQKGNRKGRIPHTKLCTWYRKACSFFKRMDEWKPDRQQISS